MQFHLNGFRPGDPRIAEPADPEVVARHTGELPDEVDVLIVGSGPAALVLAAQLAQFPELTTRIVEQKSGPIQLGQADGIACRTMEMFEALGFADQVLQEAYWVNETTFWKPDDTRPDTIVRSSRIQDTEDGLSEFPHVILNQARVHDFLLERMRNAPTRLEPTYACRLSDLQVAPTDAHPVTVTLEHLTDDRHGDQTQVRARYVVGCDGARSTVRTLMGRTLHGDSANRAWGVMDVLTVTDFPDIRLKSAIHSANEGNLLIIPREGGHLVRLYVEMDELAEGERLDRDAITADDLVVAARRILHPYHLEVHEVAWWSVYEIGQRLTDRFDDLDDHAVDHRTPHVFIAGDACHTHSPKAGQGMNVSMRDAFNLGWKLAAVLRGQASPALLHTYSTERHAVAKELIDFDREFARMFSARPKAADDHEGDGVDPGEFQRYFVKQARFTAGTETHYAPSLITEPTHQHLAPGFTIGRRFHSAPVIRLADAKPVHLGHTVTADGRWRLFAFADAADPADERSRLRALCAALADDPGSPIVRFTPDGADPDAVIDLRAVLQQHHNAVDLRALPALLFPRKGRYGLLDYQKVFCPDLQDGPDIYDLRGIDRDGCIVIVRPDQHVAGILPLDDHAALTDFFTGFMLEAQDRQPT
jgi:2-polyprenyl-6-methoxyphenol hydroxylase-like FAD-dependent oxidoreductase